MFGKLFGAIGIILSSPTSAGCGQTRVEMVSDGNGGCVPVMSDEEQPDTSANPDPEDNKPDTTENKKTEKDKKASSKEKPARDLISGGEKRSKSYHSELEDKTPSELDKLAKQGGKEGYRAKKMLKLINERPRLQNRRKK